MIHISDCYTKALCDLFKSVQSTDVRWGCDLTWLRKLPVCILGPWEGFQSFRFFETSVSRRLVFPLRGDGGLCVREKGISFLL